MTLVGKRWPFLKISSRPFTEKPAGLTATAGNGLVELNWSANVESDLVGYNVYQSTSSGGPWIGPINGTLVASTYVDTGLVNGTTYYYVVTAVDTSSNESLASDEASATPEEAQGAALLFNGSNQYVTFGAASGLGASVFTLECWFYWTGGGATTTTGTGGLNPVIPLVTKGRGEGDGSNVDMNYFLGISGGKLAADFEAYSGGQNYPVIGTTTVTANAWHHAAATYNGSCWQLYLDGNPDTAGTTCPGLVPRYDSIQHAGIGTAMTSAGSAAGFFQGRIDEVRIWNVARTDAEISGNMDQEITSATGLIGRWGMNEGTGTIISDSSGSNVNGNMINSPIWATGAPLTP